MYIQWCVKGVVGQANRWSDGLTEQDARDIIDKKQGLLCNLWRIKMRQPSPADRRAMLTAANLDLHINNYAIIQNDTPFISLAAGCVERDTFYRTNRVYPANRVALDFATESGRRPGYLYYLWVIAGLKRAVEVEQVAEEVRNLNVYQSWSTYQLEGELTAKIYIPSIQIHHVERWVPDQSGGARFDSWRYENTDFADPTVVSNVRESF